ncbi:MAG: hypothetical protein CL678_19110 [Bdellovibrionaceae bacterium]|nr:hypothetical protein [Pseudobdellovibrionaceae bacterium]|tara:strand:- start:29 stop:676 length:648 start_codon:yes stop_codon:yes gene_type:complete
MDQKLFRNDKGEIKNILSEIEGYQYQDSPLDFFIILARYKFAARHLRKNMHVLDAGCGHGLGSVFLSKFSKSVVGGDFDEEMVKRNQQTYSSVENLNFDKLDLRNIGKHQEQYDAVVSMDVIEHFEKEEVQKISNNYANLLKNNGFAIIGTPNIASQPFASERRKASHPFEFTPNEFEETLRSSFSNVFTFSMTDEIVSTGFAKLSWYLMAICVK